MSLTEFYPTIFFFLLVVFGVFVYYLFSQKNKERYLFLKISKDFEEKLREMVEKEMKGILDELKERTKKFTEETVGFYKNETFSFSKKLEEGFLELKEINKEVQKKLLEESEGKIKSLEEEIKKEVSKFIQANSEIRKSLFEESKKQAESVIKNLDEELKENLEKVNQIIYKTLAQAEREIEEYKKEKLKEVDERIYKILNEVAKNILGKTIDLSTHEKLVIESLEKAKKEVI